MNAISTMIEWLEKMNTKLSRLGDKLAGVTYERDVEFEMDMDIEDGDADEDITIMAMGDVTDPAESTIKEKDGKYE